MQRPESFRYLPYERKTIEKAFLFLVALSVLLHLVVYKLVSLIPSETPKQAPAATMVDLTDLPLPEPPAKEKRKPPEAARPKPPPAPVTPLRLPPAAGPKPVPSPLHPLARPLGKPLPSTPTAPRRQPATPASPKAASSNEGKGEAAARKAEPGLPLEKGGSARVPRGEGLFKPRTQQGANLFPSAKNLQDQEETYRKKYRDLEQGDTRMIDTEDPLIGVYAHRLLLKAQDSVDMEGRRAPPHHNGVGVLQVTILRDGSLEGVRIMEPSGNKDVDDFFIRSVYKTGYVGPLPKKWPHEKLNLVWVYSAHVVPGP